METIVRSRAPLAALLAVSGLAACEGSGEGRAGAALRAPLEVAAGGGAVAERPARPAGASGRGAAVGASLDLRRIVQQVRHAFREDGAAWAASHSTYAVRLERGTLSVTPYHHPRAERRPDLPGAARSGPARREAIAGAPVRLGPARVHRGEKLLADGEGEVTRSADGGLELDHGEIRERLVGGPDGVEQSWLLAARPDGAGDLEVRMRVAGALLGESEAGLHLSAGGLAVRYGHATWVDALGVATGVPATWASGEIVLRVPAAVVDGSVYPAVLDPVISPEIAMDEPVSAPALSDQDAPAVAWGGTGYLVVWQDFRSATSYDVYGTRVSAAGTVLDPAGIVISAANDYQRWPAVAWNGTSYLVVWSDRRDEPFVDHVYGARVSAAGVVLDPAGIAIGTAGRQEAPAVASDGTGFLVAWADFRTAGAPSDVYGARVSAAGQVLDASGIAIGAASGGQTAPAVAFDGTSYLVVWADGRSGAFDIYGTRVSAAGAVLDAAGIAISAATGAQTGPALAWDGTSHLVVWSDARSGTSNDVYGARVSAAGAVLDAAGIAVGTAAGHQTGAAVAWDGTSHLVVWSDERSGSEQDDVYGARVSAAGAVLDPDGIPIGTAAYAQEWPAVASDGTGHLVVFTDGRTTTQAAFPRKDVYGVRVSAAGAVLDAGGIAIGTMAANPELSPAAAWSGSETLVVWRDDRHGDGDVYGVRVSAAGEVLDPAGIAIAATSSSQAVPAVAWGGTGWLVVYQDFASGSSDVYGARVTSAGVVDPAGIPIGTAPGHQLHPAVSWGGLGWLVVWDDQRSTATGTDLYGAWVSGAGAVLDQEDIPLVVELGEQAGPAAAWNGAHHLLVWTDTRGSIADVWGARVSATGAVLDTGGFPIGSAQNAQQWPAVAWDGANHLVVWEDYRAETSDVYAARVSPFGAVLDPAGIPVAAALGDQQIPSVAWDGTRYLVAWADRSAAGEDLYGAQVAATGSVAQGGGVLLAGTSLREQQPRVVSTGPGAFLLAYQASDPAAVPSVSRVLARTIAFSSPVARDGSVTTAEDTPVAVALSASGEGGDALSFVIVTPPAHGTLTGTAPELTYVPAANYHGPDAFTFSAGDGVVTSAPATVSVTVTSVEDAPVALAGAAEVEQDGLVGFCLAGSDGDGDPLTFAIAVQPAHGTATLGTPERTSATDWCAHVEYRPAAGYAGSDGLAFTVRDGFGTSAPAAVAVTVRAAPSPPPPPPPGDTNPGGGGGGGGCASGGGVTALGAILLAVALRRSLRRRADPRRCATAPDK